jgi:hypothetical protein
MVEVDNAGINLPDYQPGIPKMDVGKDQAAMPDVSDFKSNENIHILILQIGTKKTLSSMVPIKQEPVDCVMVVDSKPLKKRKVVMDAVVVPTLASVLAKQSKEITKEEKEEQMKKLQNVCVGISNISKVLTAP